MKKIFAFMVQVICFYSVVNAQKNITTHTFSIPAITESSIIYNNATGNVINYQDFLSIQKDNPFTLVTTHIDEYGLVDYFIFDSTVKTRTLIKTNKALRAKSGEHFPPFIMTGINNKIVNSTVLKGKTILLCFQFFFQTPQVNKEILNNLNAISSDSIYKNKIQLIVVSLSNKDEIENFLNGMHIDFPVIADGKNFSDRYQIVSFPTYVFIDKNGNLISYLEHPSPEVLKNAIQGANQ